MASKTNAATMLPPENTATAPTPARMADYLKSARSESQHWPLRDVQKQ